MTKKFKIILFVFIIFMVFTIIFLIKGKKESSYSYEYFKNQALTHVVYNASVNAQETIEKIQNPQKTNPIEHFYYQYIKVYNAEKFNINLNETPFPFLESEVGTDEIEVVISFFGLSSDETNWMTFRMIIFKGSNGLIGCLGGDGNFIEDDNGKVLPYDLTNVTFATCHFLTENTVVKYYDENFPLYNFSVDLSDKEKINLKVIGNGQVWHQDYDTTIRTYQALENTYQELEPSVVYEMINLLYAKKLELTAKIINIDLDNSIIYVECNDVTTLESVRTNGEIVDLNGTILNISELKVDDIILFNYFQVYNSVKIENILVGKITLNKVINK